ncbi:unnamed protein product [Lymnaea stagnalis]|uniref:Uncharacterized protein n=1 Tax=Lymnaea stagnalis TaxID=6523 RepID=A0AAV2IJ20_LYMST
MLDENEKDDAIESGIVILTGSHDVNGNILLTIPTTKLLDITQWGAVKLSGLILHLAKISKCLMSSKDNPFAAYHTLPLACLADLRQASTAIITKLVEILEGVEHQSRGTFSTVYFLSPKKKSKSHMLKKLLGVKPSKTKPKIPLFKVVLFKTLQELHTQIDVSQLTLDFYGTLQYNHLAWMHFYNVVIKCIESCQHLLTKLPSVKDRVELLQEYETDGQTSNQLQHLLADLMEKFHIIISESSLPLCLVQSKQTLFLLDHPSSDSHISAVHPELVEGFRKHLRGLYSELNNWNTDLEDTWRMTEHRLTVLIQLHRHRERVKEIERKICQHYLPLLQEHPIVGKTLSQAELYRAHFTTTLYEPAKELLSQATEILEAVQKLKNGVALVGTSVASAGQYTTFVNGLDITDITNCLTTSIQPFTQQLQHLQQLYVTLHIFHLLFEKALAWYKKVLKFLPESLLDRCTTDPELSRFDLSSYNLSPEAREVIVYMPAEWLGAVRVFLSRHPPPRQEHIERLDESIPQLVDRKLRAQSRSLALRLRLIQRVLSNSRLPIRLVKAVMGWRAELLGVGHVEKSPTAHHPTNLTKEKSQTMQNHRGGKLLDDHSVMPKDPDLKKTKSAINAASLNRTLEKGIRAKKPSPLDQEAQAKHLTLPIRKAKPSVPGSEAVKISDKSPQRKTQARNLLRAKSVEFNFNSSSTDGSVFDYEKAVASAQQEALGNSGTGTDMIRARALPRKIHSPTKESDATPRRADFGYEDLAFSDPSEMLQRRQKPGFDEEASDSLQFFQREYKTDVSNEDSYGLQGSSALNVKEALPEPEPPSSSRFSSQSLNANLKKPNARQGMSVSDSPSNLEERFIRLTFTPKEIPTNAAQMFIFGSNESFEETGAGNMFEEEEESGIDTTDCADPYDSLVKMIREISASNLDNTEKLKRVSELISEGSMRSEPDYSAAELMPNLGKFSKSTMDLRPYEFQASKRAGDSYHTEALTKERPVDSVLRMKKSLAKSMEELNAMYPQPTTHQFYQPDSLDVTRASTDLKERYISELNVQPVFRMPWEAPKKGTQVKRDGTFRNASDTDASKPVVVIEEESKRNQNWSDSESISPGSSYTSSRQEKDPGTSYASSRQEKEHPALSKSKPSSDSEIISMGHRFSHHDRLNDSEIPLSAPPRPASLSFFPSRNFISPSFLHPSTSLKDLTVRPSLHFIDDMETDYKALDEMEVMRVLHEDPLSNHFSKPSSNLDGKFQKKTSIDKFLDEMKRDPMNVNSAVHTKDNLSRPFLSKSSTQDRQSVPDIQVDYISFLDPMDSPDDDNADDDLRYLQASNFDRLTTEAEQEYLSQEEVAESLRKTQRILEDEEYKRRQLENQISDVSLPGEEGEEGNQDAARGMSNSTSVDIGYGSWTSKLVSALSTSSEGPDLDPDFFGDRDKPLADSDLY